MPASLVLVADDDADILTLVRLRLERSGYDVVAARNGRDALDLVHSRRPDVAIFDVAMPELTGLEVTRRLRDEHSDLPVILLTAAAFSPQELESRVRALGQLPRVSVG
jgi:CheY-like chemotaxis protein